MLALLHDLLNYTWSMHHVLGRLWYEHANNLFDGALLHWPDVLRLLESSDIFRRLARYNILLLGVVSRTCTVGRAMLTCKLLGLLLQRPTLREERRRSLGGDVHAHRSRRRPPHSTAPLQRCLTPEVQEGTVHNVLNTSGGM